MYDQSAAHWRQKVGTLGFLFRALREQRLENNNTFDALSHYVHEKGGLDPIEAQMHVWCPRRDSKGLRFAKSRASGAWRPRHAPLQTGHRPVCLTLRALTRVRHEKGGLDPLERSLACMVPEARLEGPSLREVPGFGRMAPSPRSATNRPQACLLNAPRAHASSARKRGPRPP